MLHPPRVRMMLYYAFRRKVRTTLRISARVKPPPVLGQALENVIERHAWIARSVEKHAPAELDLRGQSVIEVGAGDCLAASALFLGKGAARVDIIEVEPPVVNEKQRQVLEALKGQGLAIDLSIIQTDGGMHLDQKRLAYHRVYMENYHSANAHDFMFSFSVMEHVEDLEGFYKSAWNTLRPGAWMLHMVDLGGHELFEDPLPPLDFQTYPDWLYSLMFPKYHRATRRFLSEHTAAITGAGFRLHKVTPTRIADQAYLDELWPKLRPAAQARLREEMEVVEFAVVAQKPAA